MTKLQPVTQGRKFAQVVQGAAAIFLRDGYAGTSVDDIATAARVSKATLYSYFPNKALMFEEAMRTEVARLDFNADIDPAIDPGRGVPQLALRIAAWRVDPAQVRLYRVHMAEAPRFAALSRSFHDKVAQMLRDRIRPCLDHWVAVGSLSIADTGKAADQLVALAGAGLQESVLLGGMHTASALQATAAQAAALFLHAHAPNPRHAVRRSASGR